MPEGEAWEDNLWRKGAFEVTRKDTKAVLYSKKVSVPPHPPPANTRREDNLWRSNAAV